MQIPPKIDEYIDSLIASKKIGKQVVCHKLIQPQPERVYPIKNFVQDPVKKALALNKSLNNPIQKRFIFSR